MLDTTVHIERPEGTVIARGLAAVIANAATLPERDAGNDRDFLTVTLYLLSVPAVGLERRDVVQDERMVDPVTGLLARYRVVATETFATDHIEARCQQVIGT